MYWTNNASRIYRISKKRSRESVSLSTGAAPLANKRGRGADNTMQANIQVETASVIKSAEIMLRFPRILEMQL